MRAAVLGLMMTLVRVAATPVVASAQERSNGASVVVSRRELRVVYPRESATRWGWGSDRQESFAYSWRLRSDAIDRAHSLALVVPVRSDKPRTFASLREVVARAALVRCDNQGMIEGCWAPATGTAHVEHRAVVLVLRDSALIADLFGLRPAAVLLSRDGADGMESWRDSVRVRYVEPLIAPPSDSLRARVLATRRREEKNSHRVSRVVSAEGAITQGDTSWVTLGDTLDFEVDEQSCGGDVCRGERLFPDSAAVWDVGDTTVLAAAEEAPANPLGVITYAPGWYRRVAKRAGTTTLRVAGLDPYRGDTALVRVPPPTAMTAVVVVRHRAARVVIHPRPDTIHVGAVPFFRADVFDETGALIPHAPVAFTFPDSAPRRAPRPYEDRSDPLPPNGRRRIVATFRGHADTLTVFVRDAVSP